METRDWIASVGTIITTVVSVGMLILEIVKHCKKKTAMRVKPRKLKRKR